MKLVAYTRVSTAGQATDGFGLETQEADIRRWAKANGHTVVRWCTDAGVSGAVNALDRAGLACAIDAVESGDAQGLVVAKLCRLARLLTTQEAALAHIWRHEGTVFTVESGEVLQDDPDDPMRTAMRQVSGVFHQLDRATIALRMRKGRETKAAQGGYAYGSPSYGSRAVGRALVADESELAVLGRMRQMESDGMSLRQIAAALNADGVPTKRQGRWQATTVARILRPEARERDRAGAAKRRSRVQR